MAIRGRKLIDLTGLVFGRLIVIKLYGKGNNNQYLWICRCNCGREIIAVGADLKRKHTRSCGCLRDEKLIQRRKMIKKSIIKILSSTRVISICKIHKETMHYLHNNKIKHCIMCHKININKPINNLTRRLRGAMRKNFKKIQNGKHIKMGTFRYLDYTPKQLYNYLMNIQKLQNNKCPHCNISYDKCEMNIDHIIPLKRAKTEQEVINLFDLKNLNLMCNSCNLLKHAKDYNIWRDEFKCPS